MSDKIIVAMSGGVDSSVTAALLVKSGHTVAGITMRLWREDGNYTDEHIKDAKKVCDHLGIDHHVIDLTTEFKKIVVDDFIHTYSCGKTPNPCVLCNKYFKFATLLDAAEKLGYTHIATGHYVKLIRNGDFLYISVATAADKDQSYFLYHLGQDILSRVVFPLGDIGSKNEIRKLASDFGLTIAEKADSQDICFIPDGNYEKFLIRNAPYLQKKGEIIYENGKLAGYHKGVSFYTIGQRKGLGISSPSGLYVKEVDAINNKIIIAEKNSVLSNIVKSSNFSFAGAIPCIGVGVAITAKIRYKSKSADAILTYHGNHRATVIFKEPQNAVTPGQSLVCYNGEAVIGGGVID